MQQQNNNNIGIAADNLDNLTHTVVDDVTAGGDPTDPERWSDRTLREISMCKTAQVYANSYFVSTNKCIDAALTVYTRADTKRWSETLRPNDGSTYVGAHGLAKTIGPGQRVNTSSTQNCNEKQESPLPPAGRVQPGKIVKTTREP